MKLILRGTILSLLLFSILRIIFYLYNNPVLENLSLIELFRIFGIGVRFDFSTILYFFSPFYLLSVLHILFQRKLLWIFALVSFGGIALFIISSALFDTAYFRYSNRRSTIDIFIGIKDSNNTYTQYILEFWYFFLAGLFLIGLVVFFIKKINPDPPLSFSWLKKSGLILVALPIYYIGMIGLGNRPLSPSSAVLFVKPPHCVLVTNTPQSLLYSFYKKYRRQEIPKYFTAQELNRKYTIKRQSPRSGKSFKKDNVVIFILESFARDFLTKGNPFKAKTPFLDSLVSQSLYFGNAYANGTLSTYGLVSILGSIPPLLENPYYHSQYRNNRIRGIGTILQENGYDTNYFLGTVDNSFGFKECTNLFGIEYYYSQEDFKGYKKHLSPWGVFDEPYFQFIKETLDKKQTPFFAGIFNVSSHQPYLLPKGNEEHFNHLDQTKEQNAVSYVDYALSRFFEEAQHELWFTNTLFVFVADHWGPPAPNVKRTVWNGFEIPLFFFHPKDKTLAGQRSDIAQQLDIVPTILDYLEYEGAFMGFGQSLLDSTTANYAFNFHNSIYQIANDSLLFGYNREKETGEYLYRFQDDIFFETNLIRNESYRTAQNLLEEQIKARIQRFFLSMEKDLMYIDPTR